MAITREMIISITSTDEDQIKEAASEIEGDIGDVLSKYDWNPPVLLETKMHTTEPKVVPVSTEVPLNELDRPASVGDVQLATAKLTTEMHKLTPSGTVGLREIVRTELERFKGSTTIYEPQQVSWRKSWLKAFAWYWFIGCLLEGLFIGLYRVDCPKDPVRLETKAVVLWPVIVVSTVYLWASDTNNEGPAKYTSGCKVN